MAARKTWPRTVSAPRRRRRRHRRSPHDRWRSATGLRRSSGPGLPRGGRDDHVPAAGGEQDLLQIGPVHPVVGRAETFLVGLLIDVGDYAPRAQRQREGEPADPAPTMATRIGLPGITDPIQVGTLVPIGTNPLDARCTDRYSQGVTRSTDKRAELLRGIVSYLETNGLADLSLAPMAAELGTSKRMLLYYFGSRENLVHEAIAYSRPHVADLFGPAQDLTALREAATRLWQAITAGPQQRPIRILFQLLSLAPTQPGQYHSLAEEAVHAMVDPIAQAYRKLGTDDPEARATLLVSGLRGLCQDRMITGDTERTDTAAELLIRSATTPPSAHQST